MPNRILRKLAHVSKKFPTFSPTTVRLRWNAELGEKLPGTILHIDPADPTQWALGFEDGHIPFFLLRDTSGYEIDRSSDDVAEDGYENRGGADTVVAYALTDSSIFKSPNLVDGLELPPGTWLTSPTSGGNAGKPTVGTLGTDPVFGYVIDDEAGDKLYGFRTVSFISCVQYPNS